MPTHRKCGNGFAVVGGRAHLLHQHVDMQLSIIQHIAVGLAQALQGPLHRLAVDVDPAGSARGQELPVCGDGGQLQWVQVPQACPPACQAHLSHSLVHRVHQGGDLDLPSMPQLLTRLPEAEVLGWGSRHQVRPTLSCGQG